MARIIRVTVNWTGFTGGPGYTNLYFERPAGDSWDQDAVNQAVEMVNTFLGAWPVYQPNGVTMAIDPTVTEIDENLGDIHAFWSVTPPAAHTGVSGGSYAAGSGACVNWGTADVRDGRRVRGRTFMVPLGPAGFSSDGTLDTTALNTFRSAAETLANSGSFARLVVWARPTVVLGEPLPDGGAYDVTGASISDKAAQLRSRRD
jgi:hypothetical protein